MARFVVTLKDRSAEVVAGADAYQQEGQMTTFYRTDGTRAVVDSWSTRLFSVRTSEVLMIRRLEDQLGGVEVPVASGSHAGGRPLRPTLH